MLHNEHEHCCKPEPPKRKQPPYCGKVNTAGMGEYYSAHACPPPMPHPCTPGYSIPPVKPLFVPGMSTQEQIAVLAGKVDEMCNLLGEYDKKVWGAYDEIVHACICNDAYYSEIVTETGYIPATSAKYTVVRIPFVDNGNQPIRLQLGLAYNNTTNSGLHENVFDASERTLADKLFPATNIAAEWTGNVYWRGAPLFANTGVVSEPTTDETVYTLGVLKNGFLKVYNQTATQADMNKDDVENAMGVVGVLINGGKKTSEAYGYTEGTTGMVGIGMDYDTQERFFILVDGTAATGVNNTGGCTADQLADLFAKYGCTVAVLLAHSESTCGLDCGEMLNIPYDTNHIPYIPQLNAFWYITKEDHYHNDYVREVAELMQKYGRSIWTGVVNGKTLDAVRAELADVESQLAQEVQDRKDGDAALDEKITQLGDRVTNLYNELVEADTALGKRIDKEIEDRKQAVADEAAARDKAVKDEAAAREAADDELRQSDETITGLVNQEKSAREAADTKLQQNIDTESSQRKSADADIIQKLSTETEERKTADTQLQTNIDNEATNRETADNQITEALNTLKTDYNAFKTSTSTDLETKTNQINQILADISSVKKLIAGVQATQSEIDETLTSIQNTLATMEKSFENLKQTVADLQTSWETYKETMNTQYTAFVDTVEKALADMDTTLRNWVTEQLNGYIPLSGTVTDNPVTGDIKIKISGNTPTGISWYSAPNGNENDVDMINAGLHIMNIGRKTTTGDSFTLTDIPLAGVATPKNKNHAANKQYVDDKKAEYDEEYYGLTPTAPMTEAWIRTAESDTTGAIIVASANNELKLRGVQDEATPVKITNLAEPTNNSDAATKKYVDEHTSTGDYLPLAGNNENTPITGRVVLKHATEGDPDFASIAAGGDSHYSYMDILTYLDNIKGGVRVTSNALIGITTTPANLSGTTSFELTDGYLSLKAEDDKLFTIYASTGSANRIEFRYWDGSSPDTGSIDLWGVNCLSMKYSETGAMPCISATGSKEITLVSKDSNVTYNVTLSGIEDPVKDKDAANKWYVDHYLKYVTNTTATSEVTSIAAGKAVRFRQNLSFDEYPQILSVTPNLSNLTMESGNASDIMATSQFSISGTSGAYIVNVITWLFNTTSSPVSIAAKSAIGATIVYKNTDL